MKKTIILLIGAISFSLGSVNIADVNLNKNVPNEVKEKWNVSFEENIGSTYSYSENSKNFVSIETDKNSKLVKKIFSSINQKEVPEDLFKDNLINNIIKVNSTIVYKNKLGGLTTIEKPIEATSQALVELEFQNNIIEASSLAEDSNYVKYSFSVIDKNKSVNKVKKITTIFTSPENSESLVEFYAESLD